MALSRQIRASGRASWRLLARSASLGLSLGLGCTVAGAKGTDAANEVLQFPVARQSGARVVVQHWQVPVERVRLAGGKRDTGTQVCAHEERHLSADIERLAQGFPGRVGIAVRKAGCDWTAGFNAEDFMPQQSVSKLWVALATFDAVDRGRLALDQRLTLTPDDLTLFNQPLRAAVLDRGELSLTVRTLLEHALIRSDNLANNRLLRSVGGPLAVRAVLAGKGVKGIRFGPGERLLQSRIAGLTWDSRYEQGRAFEAARAALPLARRDAAMRRYLASPIDGAEPEAIADTLLRLADGDLLSPASTRAMLAILARTHSGPLRIKAGVPAGWTVYHKTGTGQILGSLATGFNDVALLRAPSGELYALAVMIAQTRVPIPERLALMQHVARAVVQNARRQP